MTGFLAESFRVTAISSLDSVFQIVNSTFKNASNIQSKGMAINGLESNVTIEGSNFIDLRSHSGSAIYVTSMPNLPTARLFTVSRSNFINISSIEGGAIFTKDINAIFKNSMFLNNSAGINGGSLYLGCSRKSIRGKYYHPA
jgi:hypothetical protein